MLQILQTSDHFLFSLINGLLHTPFFNKLFLFFSLSGYWFIVWIGIGVLLIVWPKPFTKKRIAILIGSGIVSNLIANIMKLVIARPRPEFGVLNALVVPASDTSFSFPSIHAASAFALAAVFAGYRKQYGWIYYFVALLIGFSRIYLGLHYPSDVVAGAVIGWGVGYGAVILSMRRSI